MVARGTWAEGLDWVCHSIMQTSSESKPAFFGTSFFRLYTRRLKTTVSDWRERITGSNKKLVSSNLPVENVGDHPTALGSPVRKRHCRLQTTTNHNHHPHHYHHHHPNTNHHHTNTHNNNNTNNTNNCRISVEHPPTSILAARGWTGPRERERERDREIDVYVYAYTYVCIYIYI